ncbi:MHYT domain-containing protein [Alsobacter sp. SYSU BS001988]
MHHSGVHDSSLVLLSIAIAIFASYTALDLAARMRSASGASRWGWLLAAAVTMGGGIWSMHFVAMLAFSVSGLEVAYSLPLTLLSLLLPIGVTAASFAVVSRRDSAPVSVALGGIVMGLGIAWMHYTGMAAMRMPAALSHDRLWLTSSILIAVAASTAALWLAFRQASFSMRLAGSVVMGLAVAGMHYAAMQGTVFASHPGLDGGDAAASVGQTVLALWVTTTTFMILLLAMIAAMLDRRYALRLELEAAALRQSEERFRLLVQSVTDYAIFMLDPAGRVANWNAGAERLHQYSEEEIVGQPFSTFYTNEDQESGKPSVALQTARTSGKFEGEGWRVRKTGSRFWAGVVIDKVCDETGDLLGFVKVTRDISAWKSAQEELEQTRAALFQAQKMEAIGQLTGGVAHDFNNLLMAILGSLELIRKRPPEDPRTLRLLDNAIQGAQRGAALTQRMLAFARRQHLHPEPVKVPDLVNGMSDLLNRSITSAHQIETRFPLGLPPAMVDPHQLELALLNLVVNARDAMPQGGTILIAGHARPAPEGGPAMVCLSVSDEGVGMDPETLSRATEPFYTTKGVGKGTGLGLSMVQGLAEQSQGQFVITSALGEGTTAEIRLPIAVGQLQPEKEMPEQGDQTPTRGLKILLVDDDPLVLENAAAMLEDLGHQVIEASSGREALAILDHVGALDAVISDQVMPGLTGLEVAQAVAALRPGLPFIIASGYAEIPTREGEPHLQKPFTQADLQRALALSLDRVRNQRPALGDEHRPKR